MASSKRSKRAPRHWLLWCKISDTPSEGSEYLSEQQLTESILLDLVDGVKAGRLHLQPLPERKKTPTKAAFAPPKAQKPLDTPPSESGK